MGSLPLFLSLGDAVERNNSWFVNESESIGGD